MKNKDMCSKLVEDNKKFKQQLKEKDNKIKRLTYDYDSLCDVTCKLITDTLSSIENISRQKVIAELKTIKDYFVIEHIDSNKKDNDDLKITKDCCEVVNYIDKRIAELEKREKL